MPVFLEKGFQATSMSILAATVGGSKQTLYKHFSSKEELFLAILDALCSEILLVFQEQAIDDNEVDLRSALHRLGMHLVTAMNTPELIAFRRIVIAEGAYSGLGRQIYETGSKRGLKLIAAVLERLMKNGIMARASSWHAAQQFVALCECGEPMHFLEGARGALSLAEIEASVDAAVDMMASHYAVGARSAPVIIDPRYGAPSPAADRA